MLHLFYKLKIPFWNDFIKRNKITLAGASITLLLVFPYTNVNSGGFENSGLSQKAMSMAEAYTAISAEASSIYYNPGASAFLESSMFSAGATFTSPQTSFLSPYSGSYDKNQNAAFPFHLYGIIKLNEVSTVGISINSPFRYETEWNDL